MDGQSIDEQLQLRVEVFDPEDLLILSREYQHSGTVHYSSNSGGVHKVCITPTTEFKKRTTRMVSLSCDFFYSSPNFSESVLGHPKCWSCELY